MSAAREPPLLRPPSQSRNSQRPPRILLADDDADSRELVATSLREDGYEIVEAEDGGRLLVDLAAMYAVERPIDPVDLIVSDVRMPVCTGLDILKALRDAHWSTPFILITAFGGHDMRVHAAHLGAFLFQKPFDLFDLRQKVKDLLQITDVVPGSAL